MHFVNFMWKLKLMFDSTFVVFVYHIPTSASLSILLGIWISGFYSTRLNTLKTCVDMFKTLSGSD